MKHIALSAFILAMAAPLPALAQQQAGETPLEYAQRIDACDGTEVLDAGLTTDGELTVVCAAGTTTNQLSPAVAAGIFVLGLGLIGGTSSSSDTQ